MRKSLQYGRHYLRAKGRHGTHSPFVYAFVEQVLRNHERFHIARSLTYMSSREANLAARTIQYVKPKKILADTELMPWLQALLPQLNIDMPVVSALYPDALIDTSVGDTLLVSFADFPVRELLQQSLLQHETLKVLILQPHRSDYAEEFWYILSDAPLIKQRLDLWHIGLLVSDPAFKGSQYFRLR